MMRPLRRAHLIVWCAIAVLVPLLVAASLAVRTSTTPLNSNLGGEHVR